MVPHLQTALTGPINELEARILEGMPAIERWFRLEWMEHTPPFWASVELRNAGYKLAPVDTELFPRCFHHLAADTLPLAVQAAMAAIEKICPEAKHLLLLPDRQALKRPAYRLHLQRLVQVFTQAGLKVRLGALDPAVSEPVALALPEGGSLTLEPLERSRRRLGLKHFDPCTILNDDDLSQGTPEVLRELHEQYLLPPLHAGWGTRRRSVHFDRYEQVAKRFAKLLGMDAWLIQPLHAACAPLDLQQPQDLARLRGEADALLARIRRKHRDYGILERPGLVVLPEAGPRGGTAEGQALRIEEAAQIDTLPARCPSLGRAAALGLVLLEDVPSHERIDQSVAEPVVTTLDRYVVGGHYRRFRLAADASADRPADATADRQAEAALQSDAAAQREEPLPLAFEPRASLPRPGEVPGASPPNRFYMYGVIARLAMLAASYELEATDPALAELEAD